MITSHQRRANDRRRAEHNLWARIGRDSRPASREGLDDDMVELLERAGVRFVPHGAGDCATRAEAAGVPTVRIGADGREVER